MPDLLTVPGQTVTVQGGPPSDVQTTPTPAPGVIPASPMAGLAVPGSPVQAAPVPPPAPQADADSVKGSFFGKLLSGLSGSHTEYQIDPNTGKTISNTVKEPPGQTFRNLLAVGLMGAQGIGHKEGEHTFTQGLLAGLEGGTRESVNRNDDLDKQRRAQAQQQYANELKAKEDQREQKKLTLQEQLNAVTIANHNQEMAARASIMQEQAYNFSKQKLVDIAKPMIDNSELQVSADKPMVSAYSELGIDPIQGYQNVTANELHQYLTDHPGVSSSQVAYHVGTQTSYDPSNNKVDVQPLYSIYPPMTKVPPTLLEELKDMGADKSGSALNSTYKNLVSKGDGYVNPREIITVQKQVQNWEDLQKGALDVQAKQATIHAENARAWSEGVHAQAEELGLKDAQQAKQGEDLFSKFYDPLTNKLVNTEYLNPDGNNPKTNKPWTDKEKQQITQNKSLLSKYIDARYQVAEKDFFDHAKEARDKDTGKPVKLTEDPVLGQMAIAVAGLANAKNTILGQPEPQPFAPVNFLDKQGNVVTATDKTLFDKAVSLGYKQVGANEATPPKRPLITLNPAGQAIENARQNTVNTVKNAVTNYGNTVNPIIP